MSGETGFDSVFRPDLFRDQVILVTGGGGPDPLEPPVRSALTREKLPKWGRKVKAGP